MLAIFIALVVLGALGAVLMIVGSPNPEAAQGRVKRFAYVSGVTLWVSFLIMVVSAIFALVLMQQVGSALDDAFSDDEYSELDDSEYEGVDEPEEVPEDLDTTQLPNSEAEWEEFCATASQEDRELWCLDE